MPRSLALAGLPVIVLSGGRGVLFDEHQPVRTNKALVQVEGRPLLYWVMLAYAREGATDFLVAAGMQAEAIGQALGALGAVTDADDPACHRLALGGRSCAVRVVPTPAHATTGDRLLACRPALDALGRPERFAVTYSDTLSDVDLGAVLRFHLAQGRLATVVGARLPVRFRILGVRAGEVLVRGFADRPVIEAASINGGFYLFSAALWARVQTLVPGVALEEAPLEELAALGELAAFDHRGAWQCCDTERDLPELRRIARILATTADR